MSRRLTILFDAHPLIGQKTGIGYYTSQLVAHMAEQYADEVEFIGYYHNFLYRKPPISSPHGPNIRYRTIGFFPGQIVNLLRRYHLAPPIELLTLTRPDFILYPNYLGLPSLFKTPSAPVIHDLTYIDFPESMSDKNRSDLTRFVPEVIKRAKFVVTVSNYGKGRITKDLKVAADDIVVTHIPPAAPLKIPAPERVKLLKDNGITKPYMLFIGTIEPRKNLLRLLEAFTLLPSEVRTSHSLVIAGRIDWKYAETKQKIADLQASGESIVYLGYVNDELRATLYKEAALFVFPPYYEGFGMPILEALSHGTPCAVSDISVFHEVAADAVAYFDPYDPATMAEVIGNELSGRSVITAAMRTERAGHFSWQKVCKTLYERIRSSV